MGYQYIQITTSDTDVVVILLAHMPTFLKYSATITVIFGVGQNKKLYNMNEIAQRIGEDICLGIPFFYAFSGCDVTSSFYGISKNKWWEMWSKNEKLNKTFIDLSWTPICVTDAVFTEIEQMVSSTYCTSHSFTSLSELRYELFKSSASNDLRKIPRSTDALQLHALRSSYVAGWVWG